MSSAANKKLMGIDLGTTACKCTICSPDGRVCGESYREYPLIRKSALVIEQDANLWWDLAKEGIRSALAEAGIAAGQIEAIGVTSQGISFVPVDEQIRPLSNAINWTDSRAVTEVEEVVREIPAHEIFQTTGKRAEPYYVLPKLMWLRSHEPDVYSGAYKFLMAVDYLVAKLTGKCVTDHTMASGTLMYDVSELDWSAKITGAFDIPTEKFADVTWAGKPVGRISDAAARQTGLSGDTVVAIGGQDQRSGTLGSKAGGSTASVSMGTASAICVVTERPVLDGRMRVPCAPYVLPGHWVLEGVVGTSGAALRWLKGAICQYEVQTAEKAGKDPYECIVALAQESGIGAGGLFFFPHLTGANSPYWRSEARGAYYGLSLATEKSDIVRALLEGVAYEIKANLDVMEELTAPVEELTLFAGGARSRLWAQLISSVTGKPVLSYQGSELTNLGSCILAGLASGVYESIEDAYDRVVSDPLRLLPDPEQVDEYARLYERYQGIQNAMLQQHSL